MIQGLPTPQYLLKFMTFQILFTETIISSVQLEIKLSCPKEFLYIWQWGKVFLYNRNRSL